jgi:hypothetical protein
LKSYKNNKNPSLTISLKFFLDLQGCSLSMMNKKIYSMIQLASSIGQNYYPEMLGVMFIINAPMLFSTVWSGIKMLFDQRTQKKIMILGSGYQKELKKYVDGIIFRLMRNSCRNFWEEKPRI